jgi:DNA-binding response OmpR family regulator
MRILVVEDEFERAGPLVERLRRPREYLNDEWAGAPIVPVGGVGYTLAKAAS